MVRVRSVSREISMRTHTRESNIAKLTRQVQVSSARKTAGVVDYLYSGATEDVGAVNVNRLRSLQAALYCVLVSMLGCL